MKKKLLFVLSLSVTGILASCVENPVDSSSENSNNQHSSQKDSSSASSVVADITEKDLAKGKTTYTDAKGNTLNLTRSGIYKASGAPHVNSHPDNKVKQKLLVAPISFKKSSEEDSNYIEPTNQLLEQINVTFTADDETMKAKTGSDLYSVQSFYEHSSFDKGAFDVVVLPTWIEYNGTAKDFQNNAGGQAGVSMSTYVHNWYVAEYAKEGHGALANFIDESKTGQDKVYTWSDFDTDEDGYVDLLWQVYAYKHATNDTSFWWAYVTYTGNSANKRDPNVMTLAWASTQFMTEACNGYDPHTFIHETGHTLGVNDFYDYNNTWKPMGSIDYMDQNLGDHGAYTKFTYGWINPYVLKEEDLAGGKTAEITLRAGTTSGDALVLASPNYNGTAFDEYFMVELMGPYGLAKADYINGYSNTKGYTEPGLRITHVDARMYQTNYLEPVSDPDALGREGGDMLFANTYGGRAGVGKDSDYWPVESSKNAPAAAQKYLKENAGSKYGNPTTIKSGKTSYFTEISLMESVPGDTNWTTSANYQATSSKTLFKKNNYFSLKTNKGKPTNWASSFMPSGSNLWNKAKKNYYLSGNNNVYTIDESMTCNFYLKVIDIVKDDTYGAIATITVNLI